MATLTGDTNQTPAKDKFSPRSSFMELCEYDSTARTLDVTFKTGSVHRYLFVFPTTYQTFKESPTHDAYYSKLIRGKMVSVKIKDHNVGKVVSHPMKEKKVRKTLNDGIKWQPGTIARAGL